MENERKCLYSVKGVCVLTDVLNGLIEEIKEEIGPDVNDEKVYEMMEKRLPEGSARHMTEFKSIIKGSSCVNCPFRKHVERK